MILKITKKDQLDGIEFYQTLLDEIYQANNFFVIPLDRYGYGIAGNPYNPKFYEKLSLLFGEDFDRHLVFISDSLPLLEGIGYINTLGHKFIEKFWPGNIVLQTLPSDDEPPAFPEEISKFLTGETINLMLTNHFLDAYLYDWLEKLNQPRLLACYYPVSDLVGIDVLNSENYAMGMGHSLIPFAFNIGNVKRSATIIKAIDEKNVNVVHLGKITANQIEEFYKTIKKK